LGNETKPPIDVEPIDPDDLSGWINEKENAWT